MKREKLAGLLLSAVFVLSLGACSQPPPAGTSEAPEAPASSDASTQAEEGPVFAITYMTMNDPFYVLLSQGIKPKVEAMGGTLIEYDGKFDQLKQVSDIEDMIQQDVDMIFVVPVDSQGIKPALDSCNKAGIPVINVDTLVEDLDVVDAVVASDCIELGRICAKNLAEGLNGEGDIAIIDTSWIKSGHDRAIGFEEEMKKYPGINIVQNQDAKDCTTEDAITVMEGFLQVHDGLDAVFATNDAMGLGCYAAIKSANMTDKIKIVSVDGSERVCELIKAGEYFGSAAQFPELMGEKAAEVGFDVLDGKKFTDPIYVDIDFVDSSNVDEFQ